MFLLDVINVKVNKNLLDEKGKIHFEKSNLIVYYTGESWNWQPKLLRLFGYYICKNRK